MGTTQSHCWRLPAKISTGDQGTWSNGWRADSICFLEAVMGWVLPEAEFEPKIWYKSQNSRGRQQAGGGRGRPVYNHSTRPGRSGSP